jgi:nucleotide-binding universal stress UspA family protein
MFETVIVGVDGRAGGRDAVALARHLAAKDGSISLAYVYQGDTLPTRGSSGAFEAGERDRAHELLEAEQRTAAIDATLLAHGAPSVGRGLHELAEREHADLIVVGSSSHGLVGRVSGSDDTRSALDGAGSAAAVAPAGYAERPAVLREIGVGYDGSPESRHALEVAKQLAADHGAKVSAFEAVSVPSYAFTGGAEAIAEALDSYVESARESIAALGVEPHAAYGVPAEELALYGASVDLLVVGSRGYGPIGRLFHGSTSRQLARTARCPLLVLTRADVTV